MLTTLPQLLGLALHLMGKDCRCALVEQIAPLLETLSLARATCSVVRLRSYGDDVGWAMADPGPGPDHRRREPGRRLEGGGETGLLAHARSGGVLLAAGRFSVLDGLRRTHRGLELRARPHSRPLRAPPAPVTWLLRRSPDRGASNPPEQGYRGHGTVHGPRHPRHHRKPLNAHRHLGDPLQPRPCASCADVDPAATLGLLRREVQRPDARSVHACPGALWRPERYAPGKPLRDEGDSSLLRGGTREEARAGSGAATHAR